MTLTCSGVFLYFYLKLLQENFICCCFNGSISTASCFKVVILLVFSNVLKASERNTRLKSSCFSSTLHNINSALHHKDTLNFELSLLTDGLIYL